MQVKLAMIACTPTGRTSTLVSTMTTPHHVPPLSPRVASERLPTPTPVPDTYKYLKQMEERWLIVPAPGLLLCL
jgi:hypothetical protein